MRHSVSIAQIQAVAQELNDPIGQVISGTGHIANALLEELLVPVKPGQRVAHVTTELVMGKHTNLYDEYARVRTGNQPNARKSRTKTTSPKELTNLVPHRIQRAPETGPLDYSRNFLIPPTPPGYI